jgi:hypothetical protein
MVAPCFEAGAVGLAGRPSAGRALDNHGSVEEKECADHDADDVPDTHAVDSCVDDVERHYEQPANSQHDSSGPRHRGNVTRLKQNCRSALPPVRQNTTTERPDDGLDFRARVAGDRSVRRLGLVTGRSAPSLTPLPLVRQLGHASPSPPPMTLRTTTRHIGSRRRCANTFWIAPERAAKE